MIEASTVSVKTMADDTLRLTIDIEPRHAQAAFQMFGARGLPCVVARLQDAPQEQEPERPKAKGGPLARLAGTLCNNPQFIEWLWVADEAAAADFVRAECGIASRAELDDSPTAARIFHDTIRRPFLNRRDVG